MYSFLVLLPLTLITAALGAVLIFSPQVRDYVDFIASLEGNPNSTRLAIQIAAHIAAYAITCFVLVATTRTISAPVSRDRPDVLCRIQMALEAIFVAVPSIIIVALATYTMVRRVDVAAGAQLARAGHDLAGPPDRLFWTAAIIAGVTLLGVVLSGRPEGRRFGLTLVAIVAGIPIALLVSLLGKSLAGGGAVSALLTLSAAVGAVGLAASVATVVLAERPLELFQSTLRPFSITLADVVAGLVIAACTALGASLIWRPVDGATFLGMFPVFFLVSSAALIIIARVFAKGSSPIAIVSITISAMVVMHSLDWLLPTREFRYRSEIPDSLQAKGKLAIRDVEKARGIMDLREAFLAWLQARRPDIEAYRNKGKTYPVLVVAAQGGGIYAAYHSALSLARLYDSCPEIVNHMFVLSGVSGGALGSAVFAELVRSVPEEFRSRPGATPEGCNPRPGAPILEKKVQEFFTSDFLTPVVDSALLFDIPSLLVPWLRFGLDRAYALEYAFEEAWRKLTGEKRGLMRRGQTPPYGLEASFYGRWTPDGAAPALFLGTTGVNSGVPVLVSQIKWAQGQGLRLPRSAVVNGREEDVAELLRRAQTQSERTRSSLIANILDFRPDLQMATSTAVALSARFPYVTPPANIQRSHRIEPPSGFYGDIKVLELLDGAYFDNSGGWVAIDLLDDLERYLRPRRWWNGADFEGFKEFADDIRFHLIRFTDRPAQRQGTAAKDEHFELLTPLVAFNTVRSARGAQLRGVRDLDRTGETFVYLSDPWFTPSLNWLLSQDTKAKIELRSRGDAKPEHEVCCRMVRSAPAVPPGETPRPWLTREILLYAKWEEAQKLNDHPAQRAADPSQPVWRVEKFVPNNAPAFETLLKLVKEGDNKNATVAAAK